MGANRGRGAAIRDRVRDRDGTEVRVGAECRDRLRVERPGTWARLGPVCGLARARARARTREKTKAKTRSDADKVAMVVAVQVAVPVAGTGTETATETDAGAGADERERGWGGLVNGVYMETNCVNGSTKAPKIW